jgi:hypothetical protein
MRYSQRVTSRRKPSHPERWTSQDEENLALEISADKRLVRLGLDPDSNPVQLMLAVHRLAEHFRKQSE